MKLTIKIVMALAALLLLAPCALASDSYARPLNISVTATGYTSPQFLSDGDSGTYVQSHRAGASITISAEDSIGSLYLMFDLEYGTYTITDNDTGATLTAGQYGMLHEYVDLLKGFDNAPRSVTLDFSSGAVHLSEIRAFTPGKPPEDVQIWEPPLEGKTDLMLMSTHGDDEQLFFAGLLPYYAGELNYNVQVVYLTDHRNLTMLRTHEMLNGLWAVGVKAYPVFGPYYDFLKKDMQSTYEVYELLGTPREQMLGFVVEQIRRFDPMVIVGHDFKGEYSHGMHMVYTDLLVDALEWANDPGSYPDSVKKYGLWDVPKTYIHLYEENPIVIDYDKPLDAFDGKTAFEVTRELGFPCHVTQQGTWFTKWIYYDYVARDIYEPGAITDPVALGLTLVTKAAQLQNFSPCKFGLYRSTVGPDVLKNDFLENITTHGGRLGPEEERLRQERLEAERLEQERLEKERLEQERQEAERLEAERLKQERLDAEKQKQKEQQHRIRATLIISAALAAFMLILFLIIRFRLSRRKSKIF